MAEIVENVLTEKQSQTIEVMALRKDGSTFYGDLALSPLIEEVVNEMGEAIEVSEIQGVVCNLRDITARREAQQALQASEARYRNLVEFAPDPIVIVDEAGKITLVNSRVETDIGYVAEELIGQPIEMLIPSGLRDLYVTHRGEYMESPYARPMGEHMEVVILHKNGSEIPVKISLSPIETDGDLLVMAYIIDITAQKELETSLRTALARERELNELKSRFTSMVSHEFRTPLAVIQMSSSILRTYGDRISDEKKVEHLDKVDTQISRLTQLLEDILTIGHAETVGLEFHPEMFDLHDYCRAIVKEIQETSTRHQIDLSITGKTREARLDKELMRQIISNLLTNAIKYSPDGGPIKFSLTSDRAQARLSVKDSGVGIPTEDQERLFQSFHRAQNVGNIPGTGLGLAIVKRAVEAHGGQIHVESAVGKGTTFTITLPIVSTLLP
jgi:PAS domain S-box-containing protein